MKIQLNPDKKIVSAIKRKLKKNQGYCPCSVLHTPDTKCMCKAFKDQVERGEEGTCHCGLYTAVKDTAQQEQKQLVGRIVKIKPGAKYLCCGWTIPDWVRESELYISKVNLNGTVMIAFSDSLTDYELMYQDDIIITDSVREFYDSDVQFDNIDVRIMGVPSRMTNIKETQRRLHIPDENVFLDTSHMGCLKNAMRAWSKPTDKEFVMVLQDDIELCDDFASVCNRIVKAHPDKIIALFQFLFNNKRVTSKLPSPYVSLGHGYASGQGIIMRTEWVEDCLSGWESSGILGDDTNINAWAEKTGKEIITTVPTILQHTGEHSVFAPGRVLGKSILYKKSAAKAADWDNGFITPWTNIIR